MSIPFVLLLAILSFTARGFGKGRLSYYLLVATSILFLGIGCGFLPTMLIQSKYFSVSDPKVRWGNKNAIILLGGGLDKKFSSDGFFVKSTAMSRLVAAVDLYHDCKSLNVLCTIISSGGDPARNGISEAVVMKNQMIELAVDPNDIILEDQSLNTYQEAKIIGQMIRQNSYGFEKLILVTSWFHIRRASAMFRKFGMRVFPFPSDSTRPEMLLIPHSLNFLIMDQILHEVVGLWQFKFLNLMKRNS